MSKNKKILVLIICGLALALIPSIAFAADLGKLINPLGGTTANPAGETSIPKLIGRVINAVLGVVGSIALLMFIYGGFMWMTSSGSEQKIKKGKDVIVWAVIGLAIIFLSYAAVGLVINSITGGTTDEGGEIRGSCICTGTDKLNAQSGYTQTECNALAPSYKPCAWTAK